MKYIGINNNNSDIRLKYPYLTYIALYKNYVICILIHFLREKKEISYTIIYPFPHENSGAGEGMILMSRENKQTISIRYMVHTCISAYLEVFITPFAGGGITKNRAV